MSAESATVTGVSGRYATALFDLAAEKGQIDAVAQDLENLEKWLDESDDLRSVVESPVYSREDQGAALSAILDKGDIGDLTKGFVGLVSQNGRLFALSGIIRDFTALLASHRGEVTADVASAHPLNDAQMAELTKTLTAAVGREVRVQTSVDESLIGGLVVKVGSRMIDSSLRTKLQNMQVAMKRVG